MTMQFKLNLGFNDAREVRTSIVDRIASLKLVATMRLATDQERLDAGRSILALEGILRRDYGDYDPEETNPKE